MDYNQYIDIKNEDALDSTVDAIEAAARNVAKIFGGIDMIGALIKKLVDEPQTVIDSLLNATEDIEPETIPIPPGVHNKIPGHDIDWGEKRKDLHLDSVDYIDSVLSEGIVDSIISKMPKKVAMSMLLVIMSALTGIQDIDAGTYKELRPKLRSMVLDTDRDLKDQDDAIDKQKENMKDKFGDLKSKTVDTIDDIKSKATELVNKFKGK